MGSAPEPGWIRLDDAARRLDTTVRELSERLQAQGRAIRRQQLDGRWYSFAHASDLGLDVRAPEQPAAPEPALESGTTLLEQLRTLLEQREALEAACTQARRELAEREALHAAQLRDLEIELEDARARRGDAEESLQEWKRRFDTAGRRVQELEGQLLASQRELSARFDALRDEHDKVQSLQRELSLRAEALDDEQERRVRLERELQVMREVELSRERYCDRLERELQRRKGA